MSRLYKVYNGPVPTTAAQAGVTTGTAIKTMLQVLPPATQMLTVHAWGVSTNGAAAAAGPQWELLTTGSVAATVTAHVQAGCVAQNSEAIDLGSQCTMSTSATGYTGTAEGTITTTRVLDAAYLQPTGAYVYQFPLGLEPVVLPSVVLRVRVTAAAAVNAVCWILFSE